MLAMGFERLQAPSSALAASFGGIRGSAALSASMCFLTARILRCWAECVGHDSAKAALRACAGHAAHGCHVPEVALRKWSIIQSQRHAMLAMVIVKYTVGKSGHLTSAQLSLVALET